MRRAWRFALVLGVAVAACEEPPRAPSTPAPGPAPVVAPPAPVVAPPPAPVVVAPVAEAGLQLHLLAVRDDPLRLEILGDGDVAVVAAPAFARLGADDALVREPAWGRDLEAWTDAADLLVLTFAGAEPAWLVSESRQLRTSDQHLVFRWHKDRWQRVRNEVGQVSWHYAGASRWRDGLTLALRVAAPNPDAGMVYYESEHELDRDHRIYIEREVARRPPRFEVIDGGKAKGAVPRVPRGLAIESFVATPDGEVFALVDRFVNDRAVPSVARWPAGATAPTIEPLPELADKRSELRLALGAGPEPVLVYGSTDLKEEAPYLARFSAGQWTRVATASGRPIRSLSRGPDGVLWAVHGELCCGIAGTLWRRDGEVWTEVALAPVRFPGDGEDRVRDDRGWKRVTGTPEAAARAWEIEADQVYARGPDDLWLVARVDDKDLDKDAIDVQRSGRYVVLRSRPAPRVLTFPGVQGLASELSEWTAPTPWQPGMDVGGESSGGEHYAQSCKRVFVALADATPAEEARLAGLVPRLAEARGMTVHLVEATIRDRQQLGALIMVPLQEEDVATLVAEIARASPGLQPLLRCHTPAITRFFGPAPAVPVKATSK